MADFCVHYIYIADILKQFTKGCTEEKTHKVADCCVHYISSQQDKKLIVLFLVGYCGEGDKNFKVSMLTCRFYYINDLLQVQVQMVKSIVAAL